MGPRPCAVFLVAPLAFRAPRGVLLGRALCASCWAGLLGVPVGGGLPACVACGPTGVPGAVGPGRPRDRHTRACGSEWSISKPARALRTLRRPPHRQRLACWCVSRCVVSKPARTLRSLRRPPHLWCLVAVCAGGWRPAREPSAPRASLGASARCPARPCPRPRAPQPGPRVLRHPPHLWCLVAVCAGGWRPAREPSAPRASLGASPRSLAWPSPNGTAA